MIPHPCTVERTMEDAIAKEKGRLLVSAISSRFRARKLKTDVTDQCCQRGHIPFMIIIFEHLRGDLADIVCCAQRHTVTEYALSGFDRTIYMFEVPTDFAKDEALDRSLLILHDWLDGVTIDPEKVENEKGIILEELRGFDPEDDFYPLKIGQGI